MTYILLLYFDLHSLLMNKSFLSSCYYLYIKKILLRLTILVGQEKVMENLCITILSQTRSKVIHNNNSLGHSKILLDHNSNSYHKLPLLNHININNQTDDIVRRHHLLMFCIHSQVASCRMVRLLLMIRCHW